MSSFTLPTPTVPRRPLRSFKLVSFDLYGTCIDWESTFHYQAESFVRRLPEGHPLKHNPMHLIALFSEKQSELQKQEPHMQLPHVLYETYLRWAKTVLPDTDPTNEVDAILENEATAFADSLSDWRPFPDTVAAIHRMKQMGYILIPLSNVDKANMDKMMNGCLADCGFDAAFDAETIGSYKPDYANFDYLQKHAKKDFGVDKEDILHVAQSLLVDHVPAKALGMTSCWIDRQDRRKTAEALAAQHKVGFGWRFRSLSELADAMETE